MNWNTIGKNLRTYRLAKKFRQEDLAEITGLSTNYIGMMERGEKIPSLETFVHLANALGVSADMILADVLDVGYTVKASLLTQQLSTLTPKNRETVYAVIETLLKHTK